MIARFIAMRRLSGFWSVLVSALFLTLAANAPDAATIATNQQRIDDRSTLGRATFRQFCVACHGADAKGHGPAARFLIKRPADLTTIRVRNDGAFPRGDLETLLLAPTRSAAPMMPEQMMLWGPIFLSMDSDAEAARMRVTDLLTFLESIQEP
jgi:hypothetical protein